MIDDGFKKAKEEDRVWSIDRGWCFVIKNDKTKNWIVISKKKEPDDDPKYEMYTYRGYYMGNEKGFIHGSPRGIRTLFWDEIKSNPNQLGFTLGMRRRIKVDSEGTPQRNSVEMWSTVKIDFMVAVK